MYIQGLNIEICWVPAHVGVPGNEKADEAAKSAINSPLFETKLPVNDYINVVKQYIKTEWQKMWNEEPANNKLKQIKPNVSLWESSSQSDRRTEVILTRLRIGHSRMTHEFLMTTPHKDAPKCNCNSFLTIKHVLFECRLFTRQRTLYFGNRPMTEILGESKHFSISKILLFLRHTGLINKI